MNGDTGLVGGLVERLATRLPHRTGAPAQDLYHDDIISITRSTLIRVSSGSVNLVLDSLLDLLEDLARPYRSIFNHPPLVLLSEIYALELIADCCASNWGPSHTENGVGDSYALSSAERAALPTPKPLDEHLVRRIFEVIKLLFDPYPDGYTLPAKTLLDETTAKPAAVRLPDEVMRTPVSTPSNEPLESSHLLQLHAAAIEAHVKTIVEFVTASSWSASFEYFRNTIYIARQSVPGQGTPLPNAAAAEEERSALIVLRLAASFWVDIQKLSAVITEFNSSWLLFRKSFQNTVAVVTPLLVTRWLERYPNEFVQLHMGRRRRDNAPDTLFEYALNGSNENARRRALLHPMQTALLLLLPDFFDVASNLREAKSSSMQKKKQFIEDRKRALRNRNEVSVYCLVSLLRASRHLDINSDAALVSYVLDIQDEVRDSVFRRYGLGPDGIFFEQDIMTAAFVSLTHLSFESCVDSLVDQCLTPSAPHIFKIAVIQACSHFARLDKGPKYQPLFTKASAFVQGQLQAMSMLLIQGYVDQQMTQRQQIESASMVEMVCNILNFLDASPMTLFEGPPYDLNERDRFYQNNLEALISCVVAPDESVRRLGTKVAKRLYANDVVLQSLRASKMLEDLTFKNGFWRLTSLILMSICDRAGIPGTAPGLKSVLEYLESRLMLLKAIPELGQISEDIPLRVAAATKLETLFLVSLCSAEIEVCQIVTSCIGIVLEECRILDAATTSESKPCLTLLRNADVFSEIASKSFRFTGLVAFQKRNRGLLRRLQYPSAGILNAWETVFERWLHLSKDVSLISAESMGERVVAEWRNYSGFLASLGGICTAEQAATLEDPAVSGLRWIDRLSSENHEEPFLNRYLRLSIQLLACTNVRIRETMREILATEVAPALYQHLFRALESELDILFTGALETPSRGQDNEIMFAEQAASLLRSLVERLDTPTELGAASSLHLNSLTYSFAKFLDGVPDSPNSLRVKIKICQLCEAIVRRKEHLNLRDDVRIRNQLLAYIYSWVTRPHSPKIDAGAFGQNQARLDEMMRVQKDLDRACLKALAELTFRLPLQLNDSMTDATTSERKHKLFDQYFSRFLQVLDPNFEHMFRPEHASSPSSREEQPSMSDLSITIMSNLLSANIDVGLKAALNVGYHQHSEIRIAFVKVLYNILVQGAEFNNLSSTAVTEKYHELLGFLTTDTTLAMAMGAVCPSHEVDELTIALLSIYESRGQSFVLLEALIKQEIEETENESELLRRSCVATKMLSIYAKWKGTGYLKATLQKVLDRLMQTSKDLNLELDPTRVTSPEELQKNALQLEIVANVFIDDICASSAKIPPSFRKICSIIAAAVMPRFSEAKYTAVGAFIFLRFFCPAIVAPEVEGLVATAPSKEMRRGLLLIAKVIQNLANNVLFGAKEPFMFPLNDFLTKNIYRVTTFLREISVEPETIDRPNSDESFDFGSCVSLHRILYDHWDQVRQRLASIERRDLVRSPGDTSRGKPNLLEPLRSLIMNLGPPPLAVTWNRPMISANLPPVYSRFQDFMLRNAFRGIDSSTNPAPAVYDAGESRDGINMICIVLRYIDTEAADVDAYLYYYLKIASRLWDRPFGIFIDATFYNVQSEPAESLLRKIELLTPTELAKQLTRVYIFNMNSACKKGFRKVFKTWIRNEHSIYSPANIEYHLLGSYREYDAHFDNQKFSLNKDTTNFVEQTVQGYNITRLSKTKGKIDVILSISDDFVRVSTKKRQEIYPASRISVVINDAFRLGEVEEAPTSIQTEDDSAFGLRADNGKIVMYFTSPDKAKILTLLRMKKTNFNKKKPNQTQQQERFIKPQDVPGTLLNVALTNLSSPDPVLRLSSYNLLGALCKSFKFKAASRLVSTKDIAVPSDASQFIIQISQKLAESEPQLTGDFLNEFFSSWACFSNEQKPLCLAYMAPWIPGLRPSLLADEVDGEKGMERIAALMRKLIDIALSDPALLLQLQQTVWPAIQQDEKLLETFLEEVIKAALARGFGIPETDTLTSIAAGIGTVTLRGRVISRLRKALNRSSLRPTKALPDNSVWNEICVLLQFCLALSFDSGEQAEMYMPEIFHVVTMLANTGNPDVRQVVHRLLINTIHAACTSFALDEGRLNKLKVTLDTLSDPRSDLFTNNVSFTRDGASIKTNQDGGATLTATENLATLLFETCSVAAPTVDLANKWRSRWMGLVASTAFQNNPAIQPRAFTVMGCLAREEVDDDLLYQVLVALRNSIGRFGEDNNSDMLVAIVTSLSKMMSKLPSASRYGLQLFWLAMSLLRLVPPNLFNCTAMFLESVLTNISTTGELKGEKMVHYLLQGRTQLEEAALLLDEAYGIHFTAENFHFAACACLVRGLTDTITKATALRVLSTFLEMTTWRAVSTAVTNAGPGGLMSPTSVPSLKTMTELAASPYMALILARTLELDEIRNSLWSVGINVNPNSLAPVASVTASGTAAGGAAAPGGDPLAGSDATSNASTDATAADAEVFHRYDISRKESDLNYIKDQDLLLNTAIELVDFQYLEDAVQNRTLMWLNVIATGRPSVIMKLCGPIITILDDIVLHCQNPLTLASAHELLQKLTNNPQFAGAMEQAATLDKWLEDMGFGGLWRSCSFNLSHQEQDRQCFGLTEKLIELIII
ncbi:putative RasGAP group protein [Sordaria brevicollis]|uniref:RasGAP group protein n=1 Tax=Sordaria brevicollis TaxID=83679 RepID=A0AAE0PC25_SORBR|nr:putative RasGAP group protein [Sordaria brevicollis]